MTWEQCNGPLHAKSSKGPPTEFRPQPLNKESGAHKGKETFPGSQRKGVASFLPNYQNISLAHRSSASRQSWSQALGLPCSGTTSLFLKRKSLFPYVLNGDNHSFIS